MVNRIKLDTNQRIRTLKTRDHLTKLLGTKI